MVSGYQSREFGLGLGAKLNDLTKLNLARQNINYISLEDTILINGSDIKPNIKDDPTLCFFHTGVSNDGYCDPSLTQI